MWLGWEENYFDFYLPFFCSPLSGSVDEENENFGLSVTTDDSVKRVVNFPKRAPPPHFPYSRTLISATSPWLMLSLFLSWSADKRTLLLISWYSRYFASNQFVHQYQCFFHFLHSIKKKNRKNELVAPLTLYEIEKLMVRFYIKFHTTVNEPFQLGLYKISFYSIPGITPSEHQICHVTVINSALLTFSPPECELNLRVVVVCTCSTESKQQILATHFSVHFPLIFFPPSLSTVYFYIQFVLSIRLNCFKPKAPPGNIPGPFPSIKTKKIWSVVIFGFVGAVIF